ncbi:MAG: type I methionyl aminopeptidase [Candidatus Gracilibacteria bacterium]
MVNHKTPEQIAAMREGGKILAEILHELALAARPGISTADLNIKAEAAMARFGVDPSFKGYHGFPASICTAINEEVVHGIPGKRTLDDGDIISIDCGIIHKGMHTDAAVAVMIGKVDPKVVDFVKTTQLALEKAISVIKPGNYVGDIGFAIQNLVESRGYSIVREYTGHGVGVNLHESPEIPNFGTKGKGVMLVPGMTLAIEPIIAMGKRFADTLKDDWTVITRDGLPACQIEHTVVINASGCEVLTKYSGNINSVYPQ